VREVKRGEKREGAAQETERIQYSQQDGTGDIFLFRYFTGLTEETQFGENFEL
jgi:hypothetical protein